MELKKAIDRVAKVCPKKKELEAYQAIRFLPNPNGQPYLYATDGLRIAMARVDADDLPNLLLPVAPLVAASKDTGNLEVVEVGYGKVELRSGTAVYQLRGLDHSRFPVLPPMPSQFVPVDPQVWKVVSKVFHAAGKETVEPALAVVNFTTEYVEATDQARLVRVDLTGPWHGMVPASTFKTWPKGEVFVAFTTTHAFFWVGDELRASCLLANKKYPNTRAVVPQEHEGPFVLVDTQAFQEAVQQGAKLSDLGLVLVEIGQSALSLKLRAWQERVFDPNGSPESGWSTQEKPGYEADIPVAHGKLPEAGMAQGTMLLTGKYLDEALREVDTPNVRLCYGPISDPLRIESGVYTACVWGMVYAL